MVILLETLLNLFIICLIGFFGGLAGVALYTIMGWTGGDGFWPGACGCIAGAYLEELGWRRKMLRRFSTDL